MVSKVTCSESPNRSSTSMLYVASMVDEGVLIGACPRLSQVGISRGTRQMGNKQTKKWQSEFWWPDSAGYHAIRKVQRNELLDFHSR
jgi:hypothetical protein